MTRRNAISFWNSDDGPVIRWRCNCGHEGILTSAGSVADTGADTVEVSHELCDAGAASVLPAR